MSVESEESRQQYACNGETRVFPVPFYFFEDSDLNVLVTDGMGVDRELVRGTDFVVTGAGDLNGGAIETIMAWDATHSITIYREVEATQRTVYDENSDFPAKSHERALDKLTMLVQQVKRAIGRSFRFRESDGEAVEADRVGNSMFGLDAEGRPVFRTPEQAASWLNLAQQYYDRPMKTFANAAERAIAVPEFTGQLGTQRDEGRLYIATGMGVGDWTLYVYPLVDASVTASKLATALDLSGKELTWALNQVPNSALASLAWGKITGVPAISTTAVKELSGTYPNIGMIPGGVVQVVCVPITDQIGVSSVPSMVTNSVPLNTTGIQVGSLTITPRYANSKILVHFSGWGSLGNYDPTFAVGAIFVDDVTTAFAACAVDTNQDSPVLFNTRALYAVSSLNSVTFKARIGGNLVGTVYFNSRYGGGNFGSAGVSMLTAMEIKV